jgi:hypothetical protein
MYECLHDIPLSLIQKKGTGLSSHPILIEVSYVGYGPIY